MKKPKLKSAREALRFARPLSISALLALSFQFAGASELDTARDVFRKAISKAYEIPETQITVQPAHPGLPDNPYDALKTGDLFAFRADWKGTDPGPGGFAAADGRTAFVKAPVGLREILLACHAADAEKSLSLPAIIQRLVWCIKGKGEPVELPDRKDTITRADGGATIVFHTRQAGQTGSFQWFRITVKLGADGTASTTIESIQPKQP